MDRRASGHGVRRMHLSLRAMIIGSFCLLLLSLGLASALAVSTAARSSQQTTRLERQSLVPAVGLNMLSQDLDQERELLMLDLVAQDPQEQRAIGSELSSLDTAILPAATRVLAPASRPRFIEAWQSYLTARAPFLRAASRQGQGSVSPQTLHHLANRLDLVLDTVQSDAGVRLYQGERLYARSLGSDQRTVEVTIVAAVFDLGIGILVAVFLILRLTRGLGRLVATAEAISQGKLDVRAEERARDEIGDLARAFNRMTDTLLDLEHVALTDSVTGLGNHRAFQEECLRELGRALRHNQPLSLALIDLDDFKIINDQHGHSQGDRVLAQVASLLRGNRTEDRPFRIGGDEFALILPQTTDLEATIAMERLRSEAERGLLGATLSTGVAQLIPGVDDVETLREQADAALYEAKRRGRNAVISFATIQAHASIVSSAKINAVRRLLAERRISIVFQPIWQLDQHTIMGYEALMRPPRDAGLEGPQETFDIAEKLGRAAELDQLCRDVIFTRARELPPNASLFINLSPQSLESPRLEGSALLEDIQRAGLHPSQVVLEITERAVARTEVVAREVKRLRGLGVKLALDDVGAGNAGLGLLRQVQVDFVKIDRTVVAQALVDDSAAAVLAGIISFARRARTFVIAEGIETQAMLDMVHKAGLPDPEADGGVQAVQGYLLGKPSDTLQHPTAPTGVILPFADIQRHRGQAALPGDDNHAILRHLQGE